MAEEAQVSLPNDDDDGSLQSLFCSAAIKNYETQTVSSKKVFPISPIIFNWILQQREALRLQQICVVMSGKSYIDTLRSFMLAWNQTLNL